MENKILNFWRKNDFPEHCTVYCAVSGGSDSVCMLYVLLSLKSKLNIDLKAAHFNHHLRGEESNRDEKFVRDLCQRLNIPLCVQGQDVALLAKTSGQSIEEAARTARYQFFSSLGAYIATAHTADDHLETVLLNLIRGTGLTGLCGIAPKRDQYIRPMLCATKEELLCYLRLNEIGYVEDSTNFQNECVRNRIRHTIVPLLKAENPSLLTSSLQMTELLRKDNDYLDLLARNHLQNSQEKIGWSCRKLLNQDEVILCRSIRLMLKDQQVQKMTHSHIQAVKELISSASPSAKLSLPNDLQIMRQYDLIFFQKKSIKAESFLPKIIKIGLQIEIDELSLKISAEIKQFNGSLQNNQYAIRNIENKEITVRPRNSGDSIVTRSGRRTLKKLMIDRKIPKDQREKYLVFSDALAVLAVYPLGCSLDRCAEIGQEAIILTIENTQKEGSKYDQ